MMFILSLVSRSERTERVSGIHFVSFLFFAEPNQSESRNGNVHGSGMSHATTASPKPSFKAPWKVGDAVVGGGNAGWTALKSGHPCPCQTCSQGPTAASTGRGILLNRPSCLPDDPIGEGTELN